MNESQEYLEGIATRVEMHVQTLKKTKDFLIEKKVTDYDKIQDCLIIGQVWASDMMGRSLTYHDLMLFLGNDDSKIVDHHEINLEERFRGKTLFEVLNEILARRKK